MIKFVTKVMSWCSRTVLTTSTTFVTLRTLMAETFLISSRMFNVLSRTVAEVVA